MDTCNFGGLGIGHIHTEPRGEGKTRTKLVWVKGNRSPLGIAQPEIIQENLTQTPPALWSWIQVFVCGSKVINSTPPPRFIMEKITSSMREKYSEDRTQLSQSRRFCKARKAVLVKEVKVEFMLTKVA